MLKFPAGLLAAVVMNAASAAPAVTLPRYELDTSWPKLPLPNNWALGLINGIWVDKNNHVWVFHSPEQLPSYITGAAQSPPTGKCCVPAPAILEFDTQGNVLRSWGGPGPDFPGSEVQDRLRRKALMSAYSTRGFR